jgi:DNA-binding winged helix-turn-helix (wHTH) protein/tetratricopeptide (TPR) repeat protein
MDNRTNTHGLAFDRLRISDYVIDFVRDEVRSEDGAVCAIRPQAFTVLKYLAQRPGQLVTKKELMAEVWRGMQVTDDSLVQAIGDIRRAINDAKHRVVKTVPRRGYLLIADRLQASDASAERCDTQFALDELADSPDRRRIAVLAFKGKGETQEFDMLARGIAHDLISELSRNSDLRVISHHSSFAFLAGGTPLAEMGVRLRARYLVDGCIERVGDDLNLHIELLDAPDERVVWVFKQTMCKFDPGQVRDALVRKISGSVYTRSQHMELRRALSKPALSVDAYAQIWRAAALITQFTGAATREARELLQQVTKKDPHYAPGWAWLAELNALDAIMQLTGDWHPGRSQEYISQAARALALDPENSTACRALSIAYRAEKNFEAALGAAQRGVDVAPSSPHCLQVLAEVQCAAGDVGAALHNIMSALDLDPYPPPWVYEAFGRILWANNRLEEAVAAADKALAELPHYWLARVTRLCALHELGQSESAKQEAQTILRQMPRVSTTAIINYWKYTATDLRARTLDAALSSGVPQGRHIAL